MTEQAVDGRDVTLTLPMEEDHSHNGTCIEGEKPEKDEEEEADLPFLSLFSCYTANLEQ